MAFDLTKLFTFASPETSVNYSPVITTSTQADYSKKYQISTQSTYAPITTTNKTITTTNAPQYQYAPVISYNSTGVSGASATLNPALNVDTGPYVAPTVSPALNASQYVPSSQSSTQTPTSTSSAGLGQIGGIDIGLLLLVGGGVILALALLAPTGRHTTTYEVGRGSNVKASVPVIPA